MRYHIWFGYYATSVPHLVWVLRYKVPHLVRVLRYKVPHLVRALRYKPEGRGYDFEWCL